MRFALWQLMRFALWQLMWSAIGLIIGAPLVVLVEHYAGTPPDTVNIALGAILVFAAWGIGGLVADRWDWPRWLSK